MESLTIQLDEHQAASLRRVAEVQGRPEADVARGAVVRYAQQHSAVDELGKGRPDALGGTGRASERRRLRTFAMKGAFRGPGGSIADIPEDELLKGFGE